MAILKTTLKDFFSNLLNTTAPVTRDLYNRSKWMAWLMVSAILVIFAVFFMQDIHDEHYFKLPASAQHAIDAQRSFNVALTFLLVMLLYFLLTFSLEMRMFKHIKAKPNLYIFSHVLYFVCALIYIFTAYYSGHMVLSYIVLLAFFVVSITDNNSIFAKRVEGDEYYKG